MTPAPVARAGSTLLYDFSSLTVEPPTSNQVRVNADAPYTAASKLWLRNVTADGFDVHAFLLTVAIGTSLYLQDKNDHTQYATFDTTAAPVDKTDYVELPVTWTGNGAALSNNQQMLVAAIAPNGGGPPGPHPTAALVTLQEFKDHLGVTTPAGDPGDPALSLKLAAAEAVVTEYCDAPAAPWTGDTVPMRVHAAILFQGAELVGFRGDDTHAEDPDRSLGLDLSPTIRDLLRPYRTPTLR